MLTASSVVDESCLKLGNKIKRMHKPVALVMERDANRLMVGYSDDIGNVLGDGHPFAREFDFGDTSGERRAIRFTHAYFNEGSQAKIPCHREMLAVQRGHLEHILTEGHSGRESITMPATVFSKLPEQGTDWHRVAQEVEAGTCRGGLFNLDGSLIERFENLSQTSATKPGTANTAENVASVAAKSGWAERFKQSMATPTGKGVAIAAGATVLIGAVMLAKHMQQKNTSDKSAAPAAAR